MSCGCFAPKGEFQSLRSLASGCGPGQRGEGTRGKQVSEIRCTCNRAMGQIRQTLRKCIVQYDRSRCGQYLVGNGVVKKLIAQTLTLLTCCWSVSHSGNLVDRLVSSLESRADSVTEEKNVEGRFLKMSVL